MNANTITLFRVSSLHARMCTVYSDSRTKALERFLKQDHLKIGPRDLRFYDQL